MVGLNTGKYMNDIDIYFIFTLFVCIHYTNRDIISLVYVSIFLCDWVINKLIVYTKGD